jgi:hypothetical protein
METQEQLAINPRSKLLIICSQHVFSTFHVCLFAWNSFLRPPFGLSRA